MLKDITLGQYFPGQSAIHRLDPRTKLVMLVVYIVALFLAGSWVSYGLMLLFLLTVIWLSTIPLKSILRGMKPLVVILIFTGVLNLFFTQEGNVLFHFWIFTVSDVDYRHLPADLYHLAHCADRRPGIAHESAEKGGRAGA